MISEASICRCRCDEVRGSVSAHAGVVRARVCVRAYAAQRVLALTVVAMVGVVAVEVFVEGADERLHLGR